MPKKTEATRHFSMKQFSMSDRAKRFISNKPYNFPDRNTENLASIRSNLRLSIEPMVRRVIELYGVQIAHETIGGVSCQVVKPKKALPNCKVLYGFGGGFVTGSAFEDLTIAVPISALSNLEVVIPEYKLSPESPWPVACEEVFTVYSSLSESWAAIIGESAGGNLALVTLLKAKKLGLTMPASAVLISPWCNLLNQGDSLKFNEGRDPTLSIQQSVAAAAHYASGKDLKNPEISPIFGIFDSTFPKFFISSGTRDLLMSQSIQLTNVLRSADVSVDLRIWDGLWHVFEWNADLPEAIMSVKQIVKFLKRSLRETL